MQVSKLTDISNIPETLQIAIPFELARYAVWQRSIVNKYETNQVLRALDTWLILKHDSTPGLIQQWNKQKTRLLALCKCTDAIFRHRLQLLSDLQLISLYKVERKKDSIKICSWEHLGTTLKIDVTERLTIQYDTNNDQKIFQWIIASEIHDNKNRQDYSIISKLKKNPDMYNSILCIMIAQGAILSRLNDTQYFLSWYRTLYMQDFVRVTDIHEEMIVVRPDNNRGVKGIQKAWACKHAVTISYWKKVLKKVGIIDITRMQIESQERARNKVCKVLWIKQTKQTMLCLCDQIEILRPWLRSPGFEKLFAA